MAELCELAAERYAHGNIRHSFGWFPCETRVARNRDSLDRSGIHYGTNMYQILHSVEWSGSVCAILAEWKIPTISVSM